MSSVECLLEHLVSLLPEPSEEDVISEDSRCDSKGLHVVHPRCHERRDKQHAERAPLGNAAFPGVGVAEATSFGVAVLHSLVE